MAPILAESAASCRGAASKIPRPAQSKIPVRKLRTQTSKLKTTAVAKARNERTTKSSVVKSSVICKSVNGQTNIIRPIIKKTTLTAKNLEWTKSSGTSSVNRKSITKAKDRREKVLKQSILTTKQNTLAMVIDVHAKSRRNVDIKRAQRLFGKENDKPSIITSHREPSVVASPAVNVSMKALQCKLNLEFVPNEFFRKQILDNKTLSFKQLKAFSPTPTKQKAYPKKSLVKMMDRMTISSGCKLCGSATKASNVFGSANKYNKKTPLSGKGSSQAMRRCTWTPEIPSMTKPKVDPYQEAVNSILRLSEKKSKTGSLNPHARASLFHSSNNSCQTPDVSRRVTWARGKQKMDPYEEAICSIKKLDAEKSVSTPKDEERRKAGTSGKQSFMKQLDPYEIAMAKIKELKTRPSTGSKSSPMFFTPLRTSVKKMDPYTEAICSIKKMNAKKSVSTPKDEERRKAWTSGKQGNEVCQTSVYVENAQRPTPSFRRSLFASDSQNQNSLKNTSTPEHSTPRHVTFDLTPGVPKNVYRPLKEYLTKSILKKQTRLTDISEHTEYDTTWSSESSENLSDLFPPKKHKKNESLALNFEAVGQASPPPVSTSSKVTFDGKLSTPEDQSSKHAVITPFSRNSSLPPSSKHRRITSTFANYSSPAFTVKNTRFARESEVLITNFLPSVDVLLESSKSPSVKEPSSPPLFTPRPLSFYSPHQLSPDEFLEAYFKSTPSHDAPIRTPLVLKSMARIHKNKDLMSPIKQKLDFGEEKDEDLVEPSKDDPQWAPRFSMYTSNIFTKGKRDELLADKECERFMEKQHGCLSRCRDLPNPVAKCLSIGDDMHFLPILPEEEEEPSFII